MSTMQQISLPRRDKLLEDSIRHKVQAVVTHRDALGWRSYKSTFSCGSKTTETLCLRALVPSDRSAFVWPQEGDTLGVTFRLSHRKCLFSSPVLSIEPQQNVAIVTLRWPDRLEQLQRRAYQRAKPPTGRVIAVRFWRDDTQSTGGDGACNVKHGQLEDLSAGGMRITVNDSSDIPLGCTYQCVFTPAPSAAPLMLEATLRHRESTEMGRTALGFQIIGLETSSEGRKTLARLARIVGQFRSARALA